MGGGIDTAYTPMYTLLVYPSNVNFKKDLAFRFLMTDLMSSLFNKANCILIACTVQTRGVQKVQIKRGWIPLNTPLVKDLQPVDTPLKQPANGGVKIKSLGASLHQFNSKRTLFGLNL